MLKKTLRKIIDWGLKLSCSAVGAFVLFAVSKSAESMSIFAMHEPKMPAKLIPSDIYE